MLEYLQGWRRSLGFSVLVVRRYGMQAVVATVLVTALYCTVFIYAPYRREQRIARNLESLGAYVEWHSARCWPASGICDMIPVWDRVRRIDHFGKKHPLDAGAELSSLKNLEWFDMERSIASENEMEQILRQLGQISSLRYLALSGTSLTDAGVKHLRQSSKLTSLGLSRTRISDVALESLSSQTDLRELNLNDTAVSDIGLESLYRLVNLKNVSLTETRTTADGRNKLRKALPSCEITPDP
jgi:hypothetical protein